MQRSSRQILSLGSRVSSDQDAAAVVVMVVVVQAGRHVWGSAEDAGRHESLVGRHGQ